MVVELIKQIFLEKSGRNTSKRQARRHLLGVLALALTTAIVLPMLLDSTSAITAVEEIRIDMPDISSLVTSEEVFSPPSTTRPLVWRPIPNDDERARAILEGRDRLSFGRPTPDKPDKHITLQVGAFASLDKAHTLQAKLKAQGIISHIQTVSTAQGEGIGLRVGPFIDLQKANKIVTQLSQLGFVTHVVVKP